jgi:hypothetical protein
MDRKNIDRAAKLLALAENNPSENEAASARAHLAIVLAKTGMSERFLRTILKFRR